MRISFWNRASEECFLHSRNRRRHYQLEKVGRHISLFENRGIEKGKEIMLRHFSQLKSARHTLCMISPAEQQLQRIGRFVIVSNYYQSTPMLEEKDVQILVSSNILNYIYRIVKPYETV